jgi:uncharacterized protein involved in exopolysaccharide biosynthesis
LINGTNDHTSHHGIASDELSLIGIANTVLRHRIAVVVMAFVFATVGALSALLKPRTYTAQSVFMPQNRTSSGGLSSIAAQIGFNVPASDPGANPSFYTELVESRDLLEDAASAQYDGRTIAAMYKIKGSAATQKEMAIKKLQDNIEPTVMTKSGTIHLGVRSLTPVAASEINAHLLQLISSFNTHKRNSQAAAERIFTEGRLAEAQKDLRAAEDRMSAFLASNRKIGNSPELTFQQQRLERDVLMKQEIYSALSKSYEEAKLEEVRNTPVITVVQQPSPPIKPDARGTVTRTILGLMVGALVGAILGFWREAVSPARTRGIPVLEEFAALKRDAWTDVVHPFRALGRSMRSRPDA